MKLEIKHLAPYLPHKLLIMMQCGENNPEPNIEILQGLEYEYIDNKSLGEPLAMIGEFSEQELNYIKPILRPLSDLIKEIEVDSEKLVPMIELFKISVPVSFVFENIKCLKGDNGYRAIGLNTFHHNKSDQRWFMFELYRNCTIQTFTFKEDKLGNWKSYQYSACFNTLEIFQKLFSWHFDVFGLIDKKLAIDINRLKKQS